MMERARCGRTTTRKCGGGMNDGVHQQRGHNGKSAAYAENSESRFGSIQFGKRNHCRDASRRGYAGRPLPGVQALKCREQRKVVCTLPKNKHSVFAFSD